MFELFKKDKITKLVSKEKKAIIRECYLNNINIEEAHFAIEKKINNIYEQEFFYSDYLDRRDRLLYFNSKFSDNLINFFISFLSSAILTSATLVLGLITNAIILNKLPIFIILLILFSIYCVIMVLLTCHYFAKAKRDDKFNTKEYELDLIKEKLNKIENNYKSGNT